MEPIIIEGLKTSFMWIAGYLRLSFHENSQFYHFLVKNIISLLIIAAVPWLGFTSIYSLITADNLEKLMKSFYGGLGLLLIAARILFFYKNRSQIRQCLEIFKPDFLKSISHNLIKSHDLYNSGIKECNLVYFMCSFFLYASFASWVLRPVISYVNDIFFNFKSYKPGSYTILLMSYPFSINYSPVFELIIILEFLLAILVTEIFRYYELTFMYITSMACTQIRILSSSLCSINCSNKKYNSQNLKLSCYQQLIECVQDHKKLIRFTQHLQSTYSPMFDIQLIFAITQLVVVSFMVTKGAKAVDYLHGFFYVFVLLLRLMILTWNATKLIHLSTEVSNAAYGADWISNYKATKSIIQMIIIRSQRPLKLTGLWGLVTLNFENAVNVLHLAYSYFTVVKALDNHK